MGRHSRRGPAGNGDTADIPQVSAPPRSPALPHQVQPGTGRRRRTTDEVSAAAHRPAGPGAPRVRGGHPEQRESGGGWGSPGERESAGRGFTAPAVPPLVPRPRQEYVDAFDANSAERTDRADRPGQMDKGRGAAHEDARAEERAPRDPYASVTHWVEEEREAASASARVPAAAPSAEDALPEDGRDKRGKGLTYTGIAAAAVTTVLAVIVAGQVTGRDGTSAGDARAQAADGPRVRDGSASRSDDRATPSRTAQAAPATYAQKMSKKYPLAANLKGSGDFSTIPGFDRAPGHGEKLRYRVDVEKGLGLDGALFAEAVQKTLNDNRSWAHDGDRTFERVSKGSVKFVITLASPGTTATWCAKSGLDTTQDNVSCDSAATDRVMINAYRWAQGSKTYDDVLHDRAIHPYRQMLINHEVGHRLGHNHVTCSRNGASAPVMQQQTKFLSFEGITCKPNPWVFPKG
ncbi:DUF3152 domain-containing protein [Streptomyces sp. NPDC102406]|uniref:DUF3152 domain-containing protein n=1 Tax=Streptomyces sp. NPDC102406 TaxID=3366171 RepID=UPI003811A175